MSAARPAGFATRALGFVLDLVILDLAAIALGGTVAWAARLLGVQLAPSGPVVAGLAAAGWILIISAYLVSFWTLAGQTPGMRYMGIRVTDGGGGLPRLGRSLRRLVGMYLAALPLGAGFLLVLVDDRRRGLHDRVARTQVVHSSSRTRQPA